MLKIVSFCPYGTKHTVWKNRSQNFWHFLTSFFSVFAYIERVKFFCHFLSKYVWKALKCAIEKLKKTCFFVKSSDKCIESCITRVKQYQTCSAKKWVTKILTFFDKFFLRLCLYRKGQIFLSFFVKISRESLEIRSQKSLKNVFFCKILWYMWFTPCFTDRIPSDIVCAKLLHIFFNLF